MEFNKKEASFTHQLNTKGCCFLCLDDVEGNKINSDEDQHLASIRCLLRHLQITSFEKPTYNGKDIEVNLCKTCANIFNGFTKVVEELEKVRMKMNHFLERISKSISGSKKDSKKVQVYSKRMTDDPKALAQLAFVDNLRNNLAVKSLEMQVGPVPRINLEKTKLKKIIQLKQEGDCAEELNDAEEDVFVNEDQKCFEPEPAFPSLEPPPEIIKQVKEEISRPIKDTKLTKPRRVQSFCYKRIAETGMYQCTKCDKISRHTGVLFNHYGSVHLKKRYKCDICNLSSYATNPKLKLHQKTCQETLKERLAKERERKWFKFVCDLCGKKFEHRKGLTGHRIDVHKNINRHACNLCDKKYTKLCALKAHKDAIHFGKVFYCRFCKKKIGRKTSVYNHEKTCDQRKKIKTDCCVQIKEEVNCAEELNDAEEDVFINEDHECFEAKPTLPSSLVPPSETIKQAKQEISRPIKDTKLTKPRRVQSFCYKRIKETGMYQCTKCDKINRKSDVVFHHYESVHLKKRYKCDICNLSSYSDSFHLKVHQKICRETLEERLAKEKERKGFKFVCDLCGKRFEHNTRLLSHRTDVHKNINRYACNLCDKKYTKLSSLKAHKDAVHFGKVFYCRFCKKKICRITSVYHHEKICDQRKKIKTDC